MAENKQVNMDNNEKKSGDEPIKKSIDNEVSDASSDSIVTPTTYIPTTGKSFVLKHVFNNVSQMESRNFSEEEEHFGFTWEIAVNVKEDGWFSFYLFCENLVGKKWLIESDFVLKLISKSGNHITKQVNYSFENVDETMKYDLFDEEKFIEWEKLKNDYVKDDQFTLEVHVRISKMTGVYKDDLRKFDQSMAKFSDVILIVKERKFYISKLFLAANSPYFESLFLGNFQESKKSEIKLSGIDDDDFQNFLEVIYGEYAIDETTVEGILLIADMYDTPIVIRKCQEFMLEKSEKSLKKKLEMATKYNLEQLMNKCMSEIKTIDDIKSVLPGNIDDLDHSNMTELFRKSLELQ